MADETRRQRGQRQFREVTQFDTTFEPGDPFTAFTVDEVFGDVWTRPGLTRKERRLLSIAATVTSGMTEEAEVHQYGALKSGDVTPAEMMEVVVHLAHYAGWPKAAAMYRQLGKLCSDLGLEPVGLDEKLPTTPQGDSDEP